VIIATRKSHENVPIRLTPDERVAFGLGFFSALAAAWNFFSWYRYNLCLSQLELHPPLLRRTHRSRWLFRSIRPSVRWSRLLVRGDLGVVAHSGRPMLATCLRSRYLRATAPYFGRSYRKLTHVRWAGSAPTAMIPITRSVLTRPRADLRSVLAVLLGLSRTAQAEARSWRGAMHDASQSSTSRSDCCNISGITYRPCSKERVMESAVSSERSRARKPFLS